MEEKRKKSPVLKIVGLTILGLFAAGLIGFFTWYQINRDVPLGATMAVSTVEHADEVPEISAPLSSETLVVPQYSIVQQDANEKQVDPVIKPVCGDDNEWMVLAVGIDYRGQDYLYGLSDIIRLVKIDFTKPQVKVISLPRNLLVNPPESIDIPGPILLNQAYLFGTKGMGHYEGSGYGAGSLAETIYNSFGVKTDHYLVVDFHTFVKFIDAIGGVDVDLPTYVDDRPRGYFPPGKQTLSGDEALYLARIRTKYSDLVRISNQTTVLKAVLNRVKEPGVLIKLPGLYDTMISSVLTDVTPEQVNTMLCLLRKIDSEDVVFYGTPEELITSSNIFIPNMSAEMNVYQWGQPFVNWLYESLLEEVK